MRTTVDINDAILSEIRRRARASNRPFKEELERLIRIGLAEAEKPPAKRRYKVKPHALRLKEAFRGQSLNQIYDQIEAEDTAK